LASTSLRITALLFAIAMLLHTARVSAQSMYSLGGASILQTININDYKVVDHVTLIPAMSDIAFHPDGTLYGVNESNIYKIDTTDGSSVIIRQLPASYGWLVGLTINHKGVFFLSGLGADMDFIIKYDPVSDDLVNLGSTGLRHWDLEFYNGELYLSGGTDNTSQGFLIRADLSALSQSKVIADFGAQSYGITSFNTTCGSNHLIALTSKDFIRLNPEEASFVKIAMNDPLYTFSSGATSRTSYLGSLPPLKIDFVDVGAPLCDSSQTTAVQVLTGPGRSGVEYSIDGIIYQSASSFTDVSAGIYQIYIRDALGCTDMSDPFEIKVSNLSFTTQSQPAHCGEDNGVVIPIATFSDDSLEFSINGTTFFTAPDFNDLATGNYTIYARSKSGCIDSVVVLVEEVLKLTHQSTSTPEHCDLQDGTIEVIATGGKEPYSYTIVALPFQPAPIFTGLHASSYLIRVSDVLGCISEDLIEVAEAPVPVIEDIIIQDAHCGMPDGSAEVNAISTFGELEYAIDGGPYMSDPIFTNLEPGIYTLSVIDAFGCDTTTSFIIPAKDGPTIQNIFVQHDFCNSAAGSIEIEATAIASSLTYALDNGPFTSSTIFAGLQSDVYQVTVRDTFGCDAIASVFLDEAPAPVIESFETVDATCSASNGSIRIIQNTTIDAEYSLNNIDFQESSLFTDLSPGAYILYLIDQNGCIDSTQGSVADIEQTIILDINTTDESCAGHDGVLTIISDHANNNIQYSIDGDNFATDASFNGLTAHHYTGYLIDENGCIDSMQITVEGKNPVVLIGMATTPTSCGKSDGTLTIHAEGEVNITLNNAGTSIPGLIEDLEEGIYTITLTNDSQCTLDTLVEIDAVNCDIYIPNAFSPNGDGVNETLSPFFDPAQFELLQFQVFDRWGNNVFSCNHLCEWDGMYSGEPSPSGVYVYTMQLRSISGDISEMKGDLTLLR